MKDLEAQDKVADTTALCRSLKEADVRAVRIRQAYKTKSYLDVKDHCRILSGDTDVEISGERRKGSDGRRHFSIERYYLF